MMRSLWIVILLGCGHGRDRPSADDVVGRLAATCAPPIAVPPTPPIEVGRARIPTVDPAITQSIECRGAHTTATLQLDADRGLRSLEVSVDVVPDGRAQLHAVLSPLVASAVIDHIDKGLDSFLLDFWPFGSVSAASMYTPAVGEGPRKFTAVVNWR